MSYEYTNVKNISIETESRSVSGFRIHLNFDGTSYGIPHRFDKYFYLTAGGPFACCGIRTWSGMNQLGVAAEFCTPEFLKQLTNEMDELFDGGNVAFVLNNTQVKRLEPVLKLMDSIGRGLQKMSFRNFNMDNNNHLYIWTWKGSQKGRPTNPLY